jgi:crotonobetainyl-CoA:carnitine CoA-transferase CaiB-like acyl-CoA transferase
VASVLDGLVVLELADGLVGSLTAMTLADHGADVVKVEAPGTVRPRVPGDLVWDRNKRSVVLDLTAPEGAERFRRLAATADVVIETFAPGVAARLGIEDEVLRRENPRLVYLSVTGYGDDGPWADRPGLDPLVQARSGIQGEQVALLRSGPAFFHLPLPSYGAYFLASCALHAALHVRERTGRGQRVSTSLFQGALLWTSMLWTRAERPTPDLTMLFPYKDLGPTPTFGTGDGTWFHPMPQAIPLAARHLGVDDPALDPAASMGPHEPRAAYFDAAQRLFDGRGRDEWLELLWAAEVPAQPSLPPGEALTHHQVLHNRAATVVDVPGYGRVRQLGHAYHLSAGEERPPAPPRPVGADTEAVLAAAGAGGWPGAAATPAGEAPPNALSGVRVLDYGVALAGPFGPMIMADLGADVVKIDSISPAVGTTGGCVWAACQRGKRSIAVDLKSPEGQEISRRLIASADVVHYNMRVGVAERLGFGYEQARAVNPSIVHCHVTGYGNTGPLATWPGVDQMGQALAGIEWEQGATDAGGHPQWTRFGMCDAATGLLSVMGVLQALAHRERTGEGQQVETNILNAGMVFASDSITTDPDATEPGSAPLPARPHLDLLQRGLGPLCRLYETAEGWLCLVVPSEDDWARLGPALGRPELATDPRFADDEARRAHADELAAELEAVLATKSAADWFGVLDGAGVPCEVAAESPPDAATSGGAAPAWFDDPAARAAGWVTDYEHPIWGRLEQPGRLFELSETPGRLAGAPPVIGAHTREVLLELGYTGDEADALRAAGVVAW